MQEHCSRAEAQGQYDEAAQLQRWIKRLTSHMEKRELEALHTRQMAELLEMEQGRDREITAANESWDRAEAEYEAKAVALKETMEKRHNEENEALEKELEVKHPFRVKYSKELLNLRTVEKTLARQKKYSEAQEMKERADKQEKVKKRQLKKAHDAKLDVMRKKLAKKHSVEAKALEQRISTGRKDQTRLRKDELENIEKRFVNAKSDLESGQLNERLKAQKYSAATSPNAAAAVRNGRAKFFKKKKPTTPRSGGK